MKLSKETLKTVAIVLANLDAKQERMMEQYKNAQEKQVKANG